MKNTACSLYELLAKVAPWVPVCKPELHQEVQSALDAGIPDIELEQSLEKEVQKIIDTANAVANTGVRTHRHWSMLKQALREYEKAAHSKKVQAILRRDRKEFLSRAHPDWFEKPPSAFFGLE